MNNCKIILKNYKKLQKKTWVGIGNKDNEKNDGICKCEKKCSKKGSGKGKNQCLEISFMIFRTGSVLIVGHCDEEILYEKKISIKKI